MPFLNFFAILLWLSLGLAGSLYWPYRYAKGMRPEDWRFSIRYLPMHVVQGPLAFWFVYLMFEQSDIAGTLWSNLMGEEATPTVETKKKLAKIVPAETTPEVADTELNGLMFSMDKLLGSYGELGKRMAELTKTDDSENTSFDAESEVDAIIDKKSNKPLETLKASIAKMSPEELLRMEEPIERLLNNCNIFSKEDNARLRAADRSNWSMDKRRKVLVDKLMLWALFEMAEDKAIKYSGMPRQIPGLNMAVSPSIEGSFFEAVTGDGIMKRWQQARIDVDAERPADGKLYVEEESKILKDRELLQSRAMLRNVKEIRARQGSRRAASRKAYELLQKCEDLGECKVLGRNQFYSSALSRYVLILELHTPHGNAVYHAVRHVSRLHEHKLSLFMNTQHATTQFSMKTEIEAMKKLRSLVTPVQFAEYVVTGTLSEDSKKSNVLYILRKLKPTLAFSKKSSTNFGDGLERLQFLAGMCLHPLAYYHQSYSGALCPTDDVIAHLLFIRADEHGYWGKCNHHYLKETEIGL